MATLSRELRRALEGAVVEARRQAEAGARKALDQLAVAHNEAWPTMTAEQQSLRRRLRARARQLGDRLEDRGKHGVEHLVAECAYEHWHRMLFARFLAESGLLIEPASGVPVSVEECKELARERGTDWIPLAATFAQRMLPQIFRRDDAVLEVALPAEHRQPLERLLVSLSTDVFLADDSLGWVYQFWQSEEKDRVNQSENKIGADELPAVTQLFTEDYMVEFLLHNTLGAWWAGRCFPSGVEAGSEDEARAAVALPGVAWTYLRLRRDGLGRWTPAAGIFEAWPQTARDIRVLDPCMGSGHFLVFALRLMVALRQAEESSSPIEACSSTLRDNLFGLEIDPRCTQIGAFNLALAAWKLAGWHQLPSLNLACSGLGPNATREDWLRISGFDDDARAGMEKLYELFAQAPLLGSLINPRKIGGNLFAKGFHQLQPLLEKALVKKGANETEHELAVTAHGLAKAAELLTDQFSLVVTNVPFLGGHKQVEALAAFIEAEYTNAGGNLANAFLLRLKYFAGPGLTISVVTPQDWMLGGRYRSVRDDILEQLTGRALAFLGPHAFETIDGEVVTAALSIWNNASPQHGPPVELLALDVQRAPTPVQKAHLLVDTKVIDRTQLEWSENPGRRITVETVGSSSFLSAVAKPWQGIKTSDDDRFVRCFWEADFNTQKWRFLLRALGSQQFSGREHMLLWEGGRGQLRELSASQDRDRKRDLQGASAWGQTGVAINTTGKIVAGPYSGEAFASEVVVLTMPTAYEAAVLAYTQSDEFVTALKRLDKRVSITTSTFSQVPFEIDRWQQVADERFPLGRPTPRSEDPTQWLFAGCPQDSEQPLHVAVARLLGYRWPRQTGSAFPDSPALSNDGLERCADASGIVCIPAIKGQESADDRLRGLLSGAYGTDWGAAKLIELIQQVGYAGQDLEDWLRNGFFEQHCRLFNQVPFLWHVWDGRRDGFGALINCHKLTKANLETLTYAYLGDWIGLQQDAVRESKPGSEARLVAAKQLQDELKKILEGGPPYDIFVRWKEIAQQAIGWNPDMTDGVRVNLRPFLMAADVGKKGAGILRVRPNITWEKDRGKEPVRSKDDFPWFWGWNGKTEDFAGDSSFDGNRWNDLHYSREFKMAARRRKGLA